MTASRPQSRSGLPLALVPALFAIHNFEEWLTFGAFLARVHAVAPSLAGRIPSEPQMAMALLVVTLIPCALLFMGRPYPLYVAQAVVAVNVVSHVVTALVFGGYTPGLVTAVAINLPFSVSFFRHLAREGILTARSATRLVALAVLLHGPVLVGSLLLLGALR